MITYRGATINDFRAIAALHTDSWQNTYRTIWTDEFLDHHSLQNRLDIWESRLKIQNDNQYVMLAEAENDICGFICAFADHDKTWGTLIDNLHVSKKLKGQGIGTELIKMAAKWSFTCDQNAGLYLWVLEQNINARKFYRNLGAISYEVVSLENPGGGSSNNCRYIWTDITKVIWRD